jgi:hypothetical protein
MRVLENVEVYRARLNGGRAPLTLAADLRRGGVGQPKPYTEVAQNAFAASTGRPVASDVVASSPVPDPPARLIRTSDEESHAKAKKHKAPAHASRHHGKSKHRKPRG